MLNNKKTLYKIDSKGRTRQWSIWAGVKDGIYGIFYNDGVQGGKIKDSVFKEAKEKNIGKANYLSPENQANAMVKMEYDKKLKKGYAVTPDFAKKNIVFLPTGCPSGMVWEEYKDKAHVVYPALASAKLDGSKMYSTWRGKVFLNTRSAKEHLNFRHIEEELKELYSIYPNYVLDGEAYNHKYAEKFEELQSIFRKKNPTEEQRQISKDIAKFYVYDIVDLNRPDMSAEHRQMLLKKVCERFFSESEYVIEWSSKVVNTENEYNNFHEKCMDEGYEGSVLKISSAPYVQRKSKNVMKRKPKYDCEFTILDVIEGEGTNKGIAAKMIINLNTSEGINTGHLAKLQKTTQEAGMAKGWNHEMLAKMLIDKANYIGKKGTFEYGGMTGHGKLRFPKFKALRTD